MRVLLAGGGSGGSATPVLAVAEALRARAPATAFLFVGTATGPERALAQAAGFPFVAVSSGKWRRYADAQNLLDVARVLRGIIEAAAAVRRFAPDVALGAGGFDSVPPLVAAALRGVPVLIHQQDLEPGLANRLLAPFARRISVTFRETQRHFPRGKTVLRGNPVRPAVLRGNRARAIERFGLDPALPTLLVTGGGTGALALNQRVAAAVPALVTFCQVLHLTGRGRGVAPAMPSPRYHAYEFLVDEMPDALAAADLVVSRAGLGTLSELAALGKPMVLVPMPGSHQEANARAAARAGAARVVPEAALTPAALVALVRDLLGDPAQRATLAAAARRLFPPDAAARLADDLCELAGAAWWPLTPGPGRPRA